MISIWRPLMLSAVGSGEVSECETTRKGFPARRVTARPTRVEGRLSPMGAWFQQTGIAYFAVLPYLLLLLTRSGPAAGVTTFHHYDKKGILMYPKTARNMTTIIVAIAITPRTNRGARIN
jgi:hypothetical protein